MSTKFRGVENKIWRMWKDKYTLHRMSREISKITLWSEYLSLCFIVGYLHNERRIEFSRRQLRYAFQKIPDEDIPKECKTGAWQFLLEKGGFKFERGKRMLLRDDENTLMLSCLRQKIADTGISSLRE